MAIKILSIGKKHEDWVTTGIERYQKRLKKPWDVTWQLLAHSSRQGDAAREEESARLLQKITGRDFVVLLDERGAMFDSPAFSRKIQQCFVQSKPVTFVIGGAYGVTEELRGRANLLWSLSDLVFPHQLVRLLLVEQLYRAQEIAAGGSYHHV